jgi:diacylglycerol kinase (ATP)
LSPSPPSHAPEPPNELSGRIVILANPAAGRRNRAALSRLAAALTAATRQVDVSESPGPGDIRRLARDVDADCLLVAGGDGSVNEAVVGLLERPGARPVLGVVPQGTVNILARELGLPHDMAALARAYLANRRGKLHLGLANDRPFVLMASVGLDAEVVHALRPELKRVIGRAAYLIEAMRLALRKGPLLEIETDAGLVAAKLAVFTKSSRYGGEFVIARNSRVLTPGLRLVALREVGPLALCRLGFFMMLGRMEDSGLVATIETRHAHVRAPVPVATQVDGDPLGVTPLLVREAEETLDILLPFEGPEP